MTTENTKLTQDEALAQRIADFEKENPSESSKNHDLLLAEHLRKTVIDPAVIAGSLKLLKAHRDALYESMPVGVDLDAMDMLNIVQAHLQKVDASIESLQNSLKPVEVLEGQKKQSPLQRMKAQEAEVVDDENSES